MQVEKEQKKKQFKYKIEIRYKKFFRDSSIYLSDEFSYEEKNDMIILNIKKYYRYGLTPRSKTIILMKHEISEIGIIER